MPTELPCFLSKLQRGLLAASASRFFRQEAPLERTLISEDSKAGKSVLLIGTRGKRRVVYSLRIAQFGEAFVYDPALKQASAIEEASNTRAVPVLMAKR